MLGEAVVPAEQYHVVDSFPLPICRFIRAKRSKICKESFETAPDFGYCAAQDNTYYGYKLHAVCTVQGVFKHFQISKASVADIKYLQEIKHKFTVLPKDEYLYLILNRTWFYILRKKLLGEKPCPSVSFIMHWVSLATNT